MRIALDGTAISAAPSGARTRMIHLLRAYSGLSDRHEIVVFGTAESRLETALADAVDRFVIVPTPPGPSRRWLVGVDWKRRLADTGADALCAETLPVPRLAGCPLLLTVHDLRAIHDPWSSPRRWYSTWLLPSALRRVTRLIAVSNDTAQRLAQLGVDPERISVVGNAPDPTLVRLDDPRRLREVRERFGLAGKFVLALGHVEPRKNLGVLIDALAGVTFSGEQPTLVFAGRDEVGEGSRLAARAAVVGVRLVRTGPVGDEDRIALLQQASCVAVPSLVEGFGIVPLEAWKVGTPVVCSNAGALPEVVGDVCPRVDPGDAEGFRRAITSLVEDDSLAAAQVSRGHVRAGSFTWDAAARALKAAHDRAFA